MSNTVNQSNQKRSIRSFFIEKILFLSRAKKQLAKQSDESFSTLLQNMQEKSDKPYPNPQKWVKMPVTETSYDGMQTFIWNDKNDANQRVIFYLHGGAYALQPSSLNFKTAAYISKELDAKVVFPIYPKAPRYNWTDTFPKVETVYKDILRSTSPEKITIMGDSAGGGLSLGLAMYLRDHKLPQPKDIILLSPWLDVHTNHSDISKYEPLDPMLSSWGLEKIGTIWAGDEENRSIPYVSPLFGDFTNLGKISIFIGTHEIFFPDNQSFHELLVKKGIDHNYIVADKMNHGYPIFPIPEAKEAQKEMIEIIRER
ncbi:alpha/beta hydrolase [Streptococcus pneumoniae]